MTHPISLRQLRKRFFSRLGVESLEARDVPAGFNFTDFSDVSDISLLGSAAVASGNALRLTPAVGGLNGAAWYTEERQFVGLAFETTFQFQLHVNGGAPVEGSDGFVFLIQNTAPTYLAGGGGTLGYDGLKNSLAVEFDTFQNGEVNDPSQSHISVHTNGAGPNSWAESLSLGSYNTSPILDNGAVRTARITYSPGTLSIYLDNMTTPKLTVAVDLAEKLNLDAGKAWIGFTAATGGGFQNHDILNWSYSVTADVTTTVTASDASVIEGNAGTSSLVFAINREGDTTGSTTVNWATANRTATAGSDYTAASGQVTFGPGETQQTVTILATGNTVTEANETLALRLTGITGGAIADGAGIGTILNDDATISIGDTVAIEGDDGLRFIDEFVSPGSGGLLEPRGVAIGPDGNLYVSEYGSARILRFDGGSGAFLDVFADGTSVATQGSHLAFHNGYLYLATGTSGILRFDAATGAPHPAASELEAIFVTPMDQGVTQGVHGFAFGPDGNLYITSNTTNEVLEYDGTTGEFLSTYVASGSGGLATANAIVFGADGHMYIGSAGNNSVLRFQGPRSNPAPARSSTRS